MDPRVPSAKARRSTGPPKVVLGPIPRSARRLLGLMALVLLLDAFVAGSFRVTGASMERTFAPGDLLLVSKLGPSGARVLRLLGRAREFVPERGDVVVFRFPGNPNATLVKRVIGVPGDRVVIRAGVVTVYDAAHPQGFDPAPGAGARLLGAQTDGAFEGVVPAGTIFVLGDNRSHGASSDSRAWGYLPVDRLIGRSVLRLWPIGRGAGGG